ncbi:hypothetical protein PENSPDRAFT_657648 [Peniophora sp. CONT]|nr:hypothetical protein PENSPDRAFT_657648 [Peniophora sp. CONT]
MNQGHPLYLSSAVIPPFEVCTGPCITVPIPLLHSQSPSCTSGLGPHLQHLIIAYGMMPLCHCTGHGRGHW